MIRLQLIIGILLSGLSLVISALFEHKIKFNMHSQAITAIYQALIVQMIYGLFIVTICLINQSNKFKWLGLLCWGFISGVLVFSFGIYIKYIFLVPSFGFIIPYGGSILITTWICFLLIAVLQKKI